MRSGGSHAHGALRCSRATNDVRLENRSDGIAVMTLEFMLFKWMQALRHALRDGKCVNFVVLANVPDSRDEMRFETRFQLRRVRVGTARPIDSALLQRYQ